MRRRYRLQWTGRPVSLGGIARFGDTHALAVNLTIRIEGGREDGRWVGVPMTADEAEDIGLELQEAASKLREYQRLGQQGPYYEPPEEE